MIRHVQPACIRCLPAPTPHSKTSACTKAAQDYTSVNVCFNAVKGVVPSERKECPLHHISLHE
eukprot:7289090-Alexandrium_andersonii.AAC.1